MLNNTTTRPVDKIAAALRALLGENGHSIPETIEALAVHIAAHDPREPEWVRKSRRRFQPASATATARELADLKKAVDTLNEAIAALHKPARHIIGWDRPSRFEMELERMERRLKRVEVPRTLPPIPKRSANERQVELAGAVAKAYRFLTGTPPTRAVSIDTHEPYGAFHGLLSEVFRAFGIEKGADAAARQAIKTMVFNESFSIE
jgi:hypothetical protein